MFAETLKNKLDNRTNVFEKVEENRPQKILWENKSKIMKIRNFPVPIYWFDKNVFDVGFSIFHYADPLLFSFFFKKVEQGFFFFIQRYEFKSVKSVTTMIKKNTEFNPLSVCKNK